MRWVRSKQCHAASGENGCKRLELNGTVVLCDQAFRHFTFLSNSPSVRIVTASGPSLRWKAAQRKLCWMHTGRRPRCGESIKNRTAFQATGGVHRKAAMHVALLLVRNFRGRDLRAELGSLVSLAPRFVLRCDAMRETVDLGMLFAQSVCLGEDRPEHSGPAPRRQHRQP